MKYNTVLMNNSYLFTQIADIVFPDIPAIDPYISFS